MAWKYRPVQTHCVTVLLYIFTNIGLYISHTRLKNLYHRGTMHQIFHEFKLTCFPPNVNTVCISISKSKFSYHGNLAFTAQSKLAWVENVSV